MIYIRKNIEPRSLAEYRCQPGASYDDYRDKDDVRHSLLAEQGHICAYCMRRIAVENMKIEHWKAQNAEDGSGEAMALDYQNMLGVCDGGKQDKWKDQTCDAHRGNVPLCVNPLDASCMEKIAYLTDGVIYSEDADIDRDLKEILNLNCEKAYLKQNREAVIRELQKFLRRKQPKGPWNIDLLQKALRHFETKKDGQYYEYIGVSRFFIKKYLSKAQRMIKKQ